MDASKARDIVHRFNFSKLDGLIPCVAQDHETGQVLMVGFQNPEAMELTLTTGIVHYYSRSRNELWKKGETSGHLQEVIEAWGDCDLDTLLVRVKQHGHACHVDGQYSCFFSKLGPSGLVALDPGPRS